MQNHSRPSSFLAFLEVSSQVFRSGAGVTFLPQSFPSVACFDYPWRVMFKEALKGAVDSSGSYAGLLMDFEGIPVESYVGPESPFDIEVVGAEVSVLVKQIQRTAEMLEAGQTEEVSFKSDRMVTLVRVIDERYFVAMTMAPQGNVGKGRFALRLLVPQLRAELA